MKRLIDLSSIRENPNAGRTVLMYPGRARFEESGDQVSFIREVHTLHTMTPEPKWLYRHEPMEVECVHCRTKVDVDLVTDDYEDRYISDICPVCHRANCLSVRIELESLEDALKRRAGDVC
jgi:Zn finger protein HypA/HybF involved in hydrogenase expression